MRIATVRLTARVCKHPGLVVYGTACIPFADVYDTGMADADILEQLSQPIEPPPPRHRTVKAKTIAFRLTDEELVAADALRQTMPNASFSEAMRWIFSSAAGRELIARRVKGEI